MAGVPLIDLDVRPVAAPPPRHFPRVLPILGVLLLLLGTLGASVPTPPGLTLIVAANGTPAAAFTLGDDSLYTASYGVTNPNSESAVRRWDLTDGSLRWAASVPQGVQNLTLDQAGGVLMARSGTDPRVTFLDTGTGATLWRTSGANTSVVTLVCGYALIVTSVVGASMLRLTDARTGRPLWTRRVDERVTFGPDDLYGGHPDRILVLSDAGSVTTLNLLTGAVLSGGDLGGRLSEPVSQNSDGTVVTTIGDNRLVVRRLAGTTTAWSLVPFARLWQRTGEPAGPVSDCGPVWCSSVTGGGLTGLDPATGTPRWTAPHLAFGRWFRDRTLIAGEDLAEPRLVLLDAASGRVTYDLGASAWAGGVVLRPDREFPGQTWASVVTPRGGLRSLGKIDTAVAYDCAQRGRYLACPSSAGPTKAWRLPPM